MSDTPHLDAVRLQQAKERFEKGLAEIRAKGPPPARQTIREMVAATPLGRAALDRCEGV